MSDLFTLDAQTLATVEQGIDSLIHQLGKWCKLIYVFDKMPCNNCILDPATDRSSNQYNGVGPKPFHGGKCPVCHGGGYIVASGEKEDIVQLLIDWQPKPWQFVGPSNENIARLPAGLVQTKGFVADMPKVIQARYLIVDYKNATMASNRFVRWGEPVMQGNIVKSKYYICFWQRYEG